MFKLLKVAILLVGMYSTSLLAEVNIKKAWMPEPIPGRTVSAVFMTFYNPTVEDQTLVSASADWASSVEIHTHENDNGVMRMRELDRLVIPAKGKQELKQGGLHLMVFDVQETLPENPALSLCYSDGSCQIVSVKVRSKGDKPRKDHHHGHDKHEKEHKADHSKGQHNH